MRWTTGRMVLIGASLAVLVLPGCSGGGESPPPDSPVPSQVQTRSTEPIASLDADGDGYFTYDEFVQGLDWAVTQFQWPPNVSISSDLILGGSAGQSDMEQDRFQVGLETGTVQAWHACAWLGTWLNAFQTGGVELQAESLQMFRDGYAAYPALDASTQAFIDGIVQQAEIGDPSGVQSFIEANCVFLNGYPWTSPGTDSLASPASSPAGVVP